MLKVCGASSIDELFKDIPSRLKPKSFDIPKGLSELEVYNTLLSLSNENKASCIPFIGGGFYDHFIPSAIDSITSRGEFFTAYTPYQPELSQGTLQAIYEYQSDICRLTDMHISNASLYDGGSAIYEAVQMAVSETRRHKIIVDKGVNPIYRKMLQSYTQNLHIELVESDVSEFKSDRSSIKSLLTPDIAAVVVQNPNFFGTIDDVSDIAQICHANKSLLVLSCYPMALPLIKTPGEMDVDIVTGEGQSFGIPLSFGGPYLGYIATTKKHMRKMPGRIAGRTQDRHGKKGFVLTLQAREQHIRRDKATSNICTNQALCALRAHMYMSLLGKEGLKETASLCYNKSHYTQQRIKSIKNISVANTFPTFNEFVVRVSGNAEEVAAKMLERGFIAGIPLGKYYPNLKDCLLIAVTEKRSKYEIGAFVETLEAVCQ